MKLISMKEMVFEITGNSEPREDYLKLLKIEKYANFLNDPLKLEMFIGKDAIFKFQWEFKEWSEADMENSTVEDLLSDDFDGYILNDKGIKYVFG